MIDSMTQMAPMLAADSPTAGLKSDSDPGKQAEILFSRMMIKEMRKAIPSDGPFGGKEMSMYMDLLDDALAERIAESGNMGIAKQMNRAINPTDGSHLRSGLGTSHLYPRTMKPICCITTMTTITMIMPPIYPNRTPSPCQVE